MHPVPDFELGEIIYCLNKIDTEVDSALLARLGVASVELICHLLNVKSLTEGRLKSH